MASEQPDRGLQLVEVKDEGVRAALSKIDEMSDSELRERATASFREGVPHR
jgi:hypothetical protein